MIIIGITGTAGSGKGTVVNYLKDKYEFKHYSARTFITEEIVKQDLPDTRENMRLVANKLRAEFGSSYVAEKLYERAVAHGSNAVIESLRSVGEIEELRSKPEKFFLLAVDANPKIRYARNMQRKSSTDNVTFEKFQQDEEFERADVNPGGMNVAECIRIADALVENNSDLDTFQKEIDRIIKPLL